MPRTCRNNRKQKRREVPVTGAQSDTELKVTTCTVCKEEVGSARRVQRRKGQDEEFPQRTGAVRMQEADLKKEHLRNSSPRKHGN